MTDGKYTGLSPAVVETIAGLSAGTMATLIVHPLDIVKTRMQIHRSTASSTSTPITAKAVMRGLLQADRPVTAVYRGLMPNILGNATSWASFFFFKSRIERAMATLKSQAPISEVLMRETSESSSKANLTPTDFFVASGLAGACVQIITNPIWVLKTRMISSDRSSVGAYPSMWSGAKQLFHDEGVKGFYRGLGISLIGVSHGAVQFAVYEPVKRWYSARHAKRRAAQGSANVEIGVDRLTNEATLVISTASKLVAGAVTYPYQVIRSRLQNYDAESRFGRGITGVVGQLWREEGVRGFYRGLVPGVIRVMPATWITFLVYENVKYYLPRLVD